MRKAMISTVVLFLGMVGDYTEAADPAAWLPADINAVARINVEDLYNSPLAKKEGWAKRSTESFVNQEAFIPPGTNQVVVGAQLDISDNLTSTRKFAVVVPDTGLKLEKLSAWLPSSIETVGDRPATQFGPDGYVLDAGDGCWLTTAVSSRQAIARWFREGPAPGGSRLSRYLRTALRSSDNKAQFLLIIDLEDGFSGSKIREDLKEAKWFVADAALEDAAKTLESVKGIAISIRVDQDRTGTVVVDFEKDPAVLKPVLDKLVAAVLDRVGADMVDFHEWKWNVKGNQVVGSGPASQGSGRRLLSVLDPPSITHAISASQQPSAEEKAATTSLKYFKSIRILLDDLQADLKRTENNHALFFERYARKIDEMPRLSVDPALLDYATKVSSSLRYQAQSQRVTQLDTKTRMKQDYASTSAYVGPYGWSVYGTNYATSGVIRAQENQSTQQLQISEWKQIEEGMTTLRRALTEKYQIEF